MQFVLNSLTELQLKKLDFYNLLAIHVVAPIAMYIFVLSLEPKMTYVFFVVDFLIEKKNSLCNVYMNSTGRLKFVGGSDEFGKH